VGVVSQYILANGRFWALFEIKKFICPEYYVHLRVLLLKLKCSK